MNRADLQRLSNARIRKARVLFRPGEHSGAYYLAGYFVECALKACFAKSVKRYDFPDGDGAGKVFTHKLKKLIKLASLNNELAQAEEANAQFASVGTWFVSGLKRVATLYGRKPTQTPFLMRS